MLSSRFSTFVTSTIYGLCEMDPVQATYLGVHNFDSILPRTDELSRHRYHDQLQHLLTLTGEFEKTEAGLSKNEQIDLQLLQAVLKHALLIESQSGWLRNPSMYTESLLFGLYLLSIRKHGSDDEQLENMIGRLRDSIRFLDEARENISVPAMIPPAWLATALGQAEAGRLFMEALQQELTQKHPDQEQQIKTAIEDALLALSHLKRHLSRLQAECSGDFACGKDHFAALLREHHMLADSPEELKKYGERKIVSITEALQAEVAASGEFEDVATAMDAIKQAHPSADGLVAAYADAMERARQFVDAEKIAAIPPEQQLVVEATPPFQRTTIPYAAYVPPPPFSGEQRGIFWVTPPASEANEAVVARILRDHSSWGLPITALHEGFPGHHLQLCRANQNESQMRRYYMTSVFVEGWALYCEEMMYEQGFYSDPRTRIMQLKDQLWRACRVVIDVGLHCEGMTTEEAEAMLVGVAGLDKDNAKAEVSRYTATPTQPMSYLVGMREMLQLRESWRKIHPDSSLQEFHDEVLSHGSLPFSIIRCLMGLED